MQFCLGGITQLKLKETVCVLRGLKMSNGILKKNASKIFKEETFSDSFRCFRCAACLSYTFL